VRVRSPRLTVPSGVTPLRAGADLLVWPPTPWTLVSNTAVAVHPDESYVVARRADASPVVVAEQLMPRGLGDGWHVAARLRGADLAGATDRPPVGPVDIPGAHGVRPGTVGATGERTGLGPRSPAVRPE